MLNQKGLLIILSLGLLIPVSAMASPDESVLDEITIRVMDSENMSINVTDIALPNITGEHKMELPRAARDAPNNASENANNGAGNASENANSAAENASENANNAAENAAENANNAIYNAANNGAGAAPENAAEAANNGLDNPGQNK